MRKFKATQIRKHGYLFCILVFTSCSTSNQLRQSDLSKWTPESENLASVSVLLDNEGTEGCPTLLDENTLIFESNKNGSYDLWSLNLNSVGGLQLLTSYDGPDRLPCAHPDKKSYCFISDRSEIGFYKGEIGKPTVISLLELKQPFSGGWTSGDISPDGEILVYVSGKYIWTYNFETKTKTQFIQGTEPKWSPEGQKIIYGKIRKEDGNLLISSIWMMNADGTEQTELISGSKAFFYSQPSISPDGQKIMYLKRSILVRSDVVNYGNPDIWICNIDGTNHTQITTHPLSEQEAIWVDTNTIIFCSDRPQSGMAIDVKWDLWKLTIQ